MGNCRPEKLKALAGFKPVPPRHKILCVNTILVILFYLYMPMFRVKLGSCFNIFFIISARFIGHEDQDNYFTETERTRVVSS